MQRRALGRPEWRGMFVLKVSEQKFSFGAILLEPIKYYQRSSSLLLNKTKKGVFLSRMRQNAMVFVIVVIVGL